jgi:hypothetical protein
MSIPIVCHTPDGVSQTTIAGNSLEQTVRTLLAGGAWEAQRDKELMRGGDAVAVAITKVIGDKGLSGQEIGLTLDLINIAFSDVSRISESNRSESKGRRNDNGDGGAAFHSRRQRSKLRRQGERDHRDLLSDARPNRDPEIG